MHETLCKAMAWAAHNGQLTESDVAAIHMAITTRGKRKGLILKSGPSWDKRPEARFAWEALMANIAPARASLWSLMFELPRASEEINAMHARVDKWAEGLIPLLSATLQSPMEFNLAALRQDPEAVVAAYDRQLDTLLAEAGVVVEVNR